MAENKPELLIVHGNTQMTANLFSVLSANKEKNVFFSPISIHAVLSMVYQGAEGTTAEAFTSSLKVPDASTAAEGYNATMDCLSNVPDVTLLMANKIFLMEGYELLEAFNIAIRKQFLSEVQLVNFKESEAAAKTINDWVKEKTREKIQDLINKNDLNGLTRLVLVNAIYFKGNWKYKFDAALTKTEQFYLNNDYTVDVQMMHLTGDFNYKYVEELDVQVLQLPYTNEDLSMFIILPNTRDGINDLEKKLQNYDFTEFTEKLWDMEVSVALPRFKIEETIDLKDSLTKLGLGEIFDPSKANFSGMIPSENLYVSKAVHKAFIEVNEEGTEAAAATGVTVCFMSGPPRKTYFTVDHPFIFQLVYKKIVLFVGKVAVIPGGAPKKIHPTIVHKYLKKIF